MRSGCGLELEGRLVGTIGDCRSGRSCLLENIRPFMLHQLPMILQLFVLYSPVVSLHPIHFFCLLQQVLTTMGEKRRAVNMRLELNKGEFEKVLRIEYGVR